MPKAIPTVSIWLSRARAQLNDPLFVRTSKGMQPTPSMDGLITTVREVLAALEKLAHTQTVFNAATSQREFRIYMTDASHIALQARNKHSLHFALTHPMMHD